MCPRKATCLHSFHYKNPTKHVGLSQNRHHDYFIKKKHVYACHMFFFYLPLLFFIDKQITIHCYPLANEVAKGYSNATIRPSVLPSVTSL